MTKPPSHSLYAKLNEDQREQLYDWILTLGYTKTLAQIGLPEPDGFHIKTHLGSLHRFFQRYAAEQDLQQLSEATQVNTPTPSELFPQAVQAAHAGAFRLAATPLDTTSFGELSRWVCAQEANDLKRDYYRLAEQNAAIAQKKAHLAEKRHAFDREKFELNVARLALQHASALQRIHANNAAETQEKIRAARELLYGSSTPLP